MPGPMLVECSKSCNLQGLQVLDSIRGGWKGLRKVILAVTVVLAMVVGASAVATAGQSHVTAKRCGGRYGPSCTKPNILNKPLSMSCVHLGAGYELPVITFTSNSGIRDIKVEAGGTTVKTVTFSGQGPTQYVLKHFRLSTLGFNSGPQAVTLSVTDVKGRTVSKVLRYSICVAKPVFTG